MRILLTRLSALGDIVHTWPLAQALRDGLDALELAWVVEAPFVPLVEAHPAVTRVIPVATRRWRRAPFSAATRAEMVSAGRAVREFAPDVVLDPQGLAKSAFCGWWSRAPKRVGLHAGARRERVSGLLYTESVEPASELRHVVDINLALAEAVGVVPQYGLAPDGRFLLGTCAATPRAHGDAVALLPSTGGAGKAWPEESYIALARVLTAAGVPVVVAWGPREEALAGHIAAAAGGGVRIAPPTDLRALAALLAECRAVVGGDTGPVHLAASLGVPTVALHVATDPLRNGPRGERTRIVGAPSGVSLRGRARVAYGATIQVDEVARALDELALGIGLVTR